MTLKGQYRVFKFPDCEKYGVSNDAAGVTVAFCDKKWEADYLCKELNSLSKENEHLKEFRDKVWELLREQSKLYQQLIEDRKGLYTKVMNERLHALQLFENSLHLYIAKKLVEELPTEPIGRCRCVIEPPRRDEFK